MTNINGIADIVRVVSQAANDDWRISAGMVGAGILLGLFEGIRRWRKRRKK
ncbi:MAG: hypothetical protein L6455_13160 [Kiritimatiellae bacterium]|nr:hypothetical protein [Kiritimatiellia bacterium]